MFSSTPTTASIIEHIVLFSVRDGTAAEKSSAMISNLLSLQTLPGVSHLAAVPLLRRRSSAADTITHLLHSRYPTKDALASYAAHPDHVSVVKDFVLPIVDQIIAVDWVADVGEAVLPAGAAVRLMLVKPKEGIEAKEVIEVVKDGVGKSEKIGARQVSYGENFSPGRAKGYGVAVLSVFDGVEELDGVDEKGDVMEGVKEKVRELVESVIVVDFVVPGKVPATASL